MLLDHQVAVITGSSRGIGRAIAVRMAQEGAKVVVNGVNEGRVQEVVQEIRNSGGIAVGIAESVATMAGGEKIVATAIQEFGKIDILVNNAGVISDKMAHKLREDEWDLVINSHLKGTFSCTRSALPSMRERKQGCIINMTSTAGLSGMIGQLNYSAAKAGILGMTWTLALELENCGINVNGIAPAALTDMTSTYIEKAKKNAEAAGESFPDYWKVGSPEEVAELVVALSLPRSRSITGAIFSVNGGNIGIWNRPVHHLVASRKDSRWDATDIFDQVLANYTQEFD